MLARHYGRHIPGNPTVIPKNMPGAGTLRAANHLYNVAAKDGTELGNFSSSATVEPLMDNDQARFDATKFSWVGSMNQEINLCGIWQRPGSPTSFAEVLSGQETVFASSGGLTSFSYQHPLIFKNVLGRQRADGVRLSRHAAILYRRAARRSPWPVRPGPHPHQDAVAEGGGRRAGSRSSFSWDPRPPTSSARSRASSSSPGTTTTDKVFEFHFHTKLLGRPLAGPPGVPPERLAILRKAFQDTMRDPEFLAEAQKANLDIDPATHEQVEQLLAQFADYTVHGRVSASSITVTSLWAMLRSLLLMRDLFLDDRLIVLVQGKPARVEGTRAAQTRVSPLREHRSGRPRRYRPIDRSSSRGRSA